MFGESPGVNSREKSGGGFIKGISGGVIFHGQNVWGVCRGCPQGSPDQVLRPAVII